jgi:hypothetical protein
MTRTNNIDDCIPENENEKTTEAEKVERWLAVRKEAALQINSETAEVCWVYAQTSDPYGVEPDLPEEYQQVGREYFARSPGSDIGVWFGPMRSMKPCGRNIKENWDFLPDLVPDSTSLRETVPLLRQSL